MAGPLLLVALIALIAAGGYTAFFFVDRVTIPYPPSALPGIVCTLVCLGVALALGAFVALGSSAHAFFLPEWALSMVAVLFTAPSIAVCIWLSRKMKTGKRRGATAPRGALPKS
jgi:protein-S-isoprenylcysteine O-methyltransferase Ste14